MHSRGRVPASFVVAVGEDKGAASPTRAGLRANISSQDVYVYEATSDFAVGSWRNVFVVIWRRFTRAEDARKIQAHLRTFRRWHPKGILLMTIVQEEAPPPDRDARRAIADYLEDGKEDIVAGAVCLDGDSLRGAFVRGVATSLTLIARTTFPFRVCNMTDAVKLFAEYSQRRGIPFDGAAMPRAVHDVRQRVEETCAPSRSGIRRRI